MPPTDGGKTVAEVVHPTFQPGVPLGVRNGSDVVATGNGGLKSGVHDLSEGFATAGRWHRSWMRSSSALSDSQPMAKPQRRASAALQLGPTHI